MAGKIDEDKAEGTMKVREAIILSMTKEERENPSLLKASRKSRIAAGSGTKVSDVNRLISEFEKTKQMMRQMSKMAAGGKMPGMPGGLGAMKGMGKMRGGFPAGKRGRRR